MMTKGILQMIGLSEDDLKSSLAFFNHLKSDIDLIKSNQALILSLLHAQNAESLNSITMTQNARTLLPEPEETDNGN